MTAEIEFPVVAHHRVIVYAAARDVSATQALFADFDLVEPVCEGHASSGGKYATFGISVRFKDRAEMARFDECLKRVPGLKMVL